jgi:hypothetical protein
MPLRDHWWCILVAKYGAFLFTEIGAVVITDYTKVLDFCPCLKFDFERNLFCLVQKDLLL